MSQANEQELQSVFSIIWERKKNLFTVTGAAVLAGIAYTLFAPAVWEAKASIVFPVRTPSLLGSGSFEQSGLAATLSGGPTQLKIFSNMMESDTALTYVANQVGLPKREVKDMRNFSEQTGASSIDISARSTNAAQAKAIVAAHIQALTDINKAVGKPLVSNDSDVLKGQVDKQKERLQKAEQNLLIFQQTAVTAPSVVAGGSGKDVNIVPNAGKWGDMLKTLELQLVPLVSSIQDAESRMNKMSTKYKNLPASIPPVEKWRGKLTEQQFELKNKELTLAHDAPEMVKLRKAIEITEGELQTELTKYAQAANLGLVDTQGGLNKLPTVLTQRVALEAQIAAVRKLAALAPAESIKLSQLTRDVTTQSAILGQLQGQYQLASLQAERDPNHWEVLDQPAVDDKPVNKSFSKNGMLSLIAGLALGSLFALFAPQRKAKATKKSQPEITLDKAA